LLSQGKIVTAFKHHTLKTYVWLEVQLHESITSALDVGPVTFYPRYSLDKKLGGIQSWAECYREEKNLYPCQESHHNSLHIQPTALTLSELLYLSQNSSTKVITAEYCIFITYGFVSDDHCLKHKEVI